MNVGKTALAQLMEFLPQYEFQKWTLFESYVIASDQE
jgi:hypothetical protein